MKIIESDADLPKCLNTLMKQSAKVKLLAQSHLEKPALKACKVPIQGCFSRTFVVSLDSGEQCIIQLRVEPIDVNEFESARSLYGDVVPKISIIPDAALERDGVFPFYMNLLPGEPWIHARSELDVVALKSLGRILSRGCVADNSADVVDKIIVPKLKILQQSADPRIMPFKTHIDIVLRNTIQLKRLPLFISHADLNRLNILLHEDGQVSGIVDWEGASELPFGMGLCRIHGLAGEYINGEFVIPDTFEEGETGFWRELFDGVPSALRKILDDNLEVVQMSVKAGVLLENLDCEHGFNPVVLKALPKFLKYRIPALRREGEAAYDE